MKATQIILSFAILATFMQSCAERDALPTPAERIEGYWIGGAWNHEQNRYYFHDGAAWAAKINGQVLYSRRDFQYYFRGDTLKILDVASLQHSQYLTTFPTDSTATLENMDGLVLNLVRIK